MRANTHRILAIALCAAGAAGMRLSPFCNGMSAGPQGQQATGTSTATRRIGAVKAINGTVVTLTPDSGPNINVTVQATTRILRIAP
ncbi:MAG: hypothetical protein ABSF72_03335, partial [Candidatus Sulfotelmatobacter sp.]